MSSDTRERLASVEQGGSMTPDIEALARRAIACEGWRWMPGMSSTGDTVVLVQLTLPYVFCWDEDGQGSAASTLALPDLSDPATLGCLLALVREAWGKPRAFCGYVEANPSYWHINTGHVGETEAAALVAALEAAP